MDRTLEAAAVLLVCTLAACRQPPTPEGSTNRAASKPPARPARAAPQPTMGPRAARPPMGRPRVSPGHGQRHKTCLALYRARIKGLSTLLQKLSLLRTDAQLEQDYRLQRAVTLRTCAALTETQRRCVIAQPNPLLAAQPCRLDSSLGLRAPPALMALLSPRPVGVDEATSRRRVAALRGRWVRQSPGGHRVELTISAEGRAHWSRYRDNRPLGRGESGQLSVPRRGVLRLKRAVTEQRLVYFQVDRNTLLLSANPLHTVTPIRSRNGFRLPLAADRVLRLAAGQCEVIDLSHLAAHPATCRWAPDAMTRVPVLRVDYALGRWKIQQRFYLVRSQLLHEQLYRRRYVRS